MLVPSDAATGDGFGSSVAISGDTIVVGAPTKDDPVNGNDAGAVYVFVRTGTSWTQHAKLTASDAAADATFGRSVSISGDRVVIGASAFPPATVPGSAYVFVRSGTNWTEQQKLTPLDGEPGDEFGFSVGIDGDTIVCVP